jgi:hypothetical protein
MISTVQQEYEIRKNEINEYFSIIYQFNSGVKLISPDESRVVSPSNRFITVSKATIVLLLYNLVESTTTNLLNEIHNSITQSNVNYHDLIPSVQHLLITYYMLLHKKKNNVHESVKDLSTLINIVKNGMPFSLLYNEMVRYYSLYSGNIDSKKITAIFSKYGINISTSMGELKKIKDERNSISHGIVSFEECGRNLSIEYIKTVIDKTYAYFEDIINIVKQYIENTEFKIR